MKRGTYKHPKTTGLMIALGVNRREATGLLQMLWEWTGEYAPRGDIGRWSDADIATALEWEADDATNLMRTLIDCGFVEEHGDHRLIIHDWDDHVEDYIRKRLMRQHLEIVKSNGCQRLPTADNGGQRRPAMPTQAKPIQAKPTKSRERSETLGWTPERRWFGVSDEDRQTWAEAYPACDLDTELAKMTAWLVANPTQRKKNWRAFIVRWLNRNQDNGGTRRSNAPGLKHTDAPLSRVHAPDPSRFSRTSTTIAVGDGREVSRQGP